MARYRAGGSIFVKEISVTDVTISNNLIVGNNATVSGDVTIGDALDVSGNIDVDGKQTGPSQSFKTTLSPGDT